MRIICPCCSTIFTVPEQAVGFGDSVACSICDYEWVLESTQENVDTNTPPAIEARHAKGKLGDSEGKNRQSTYQDNRAWDDNNWDSREWNGENPPPLVSNPQRKTGERHRSHSILVKLFFLFASCFVLTGAIFMFIYPDVGKAYIKRYIPSSVALIQWFSLPTGGKGDSALYIYGSKAILVEGEKGKQLLVYGRVQNRKKLTVKGIDVDVELLDVSGNLIETVKRKIPIEVGAGQVKPFKARIDNPPVNVSDVNVKQSR